MGCLNDSSRAILSSDRGVWEGVGRPGEEHSDKKRLSLLLFLASCLKPGLVNIFV